MWIMNNVALINILVECEILIGRHTHDARMRKKLYPLLPLLLLVPIFLLAFTIICQLINMLSYKYNRHKTKGEKIGNHLAAYLNIFLRNQKIQLIDYSIIGVTHCRVGKTQQ